MENENGDLLTLLTEENEFLKKVNEELLGIMRRNRSWVTGNVSTDTEGILIRLLEKQLDDKLLIKDPVTPTKSIHPTNETPSSHISPPHSPFLLTPETPTEKDINAWQRVATKEKMNIQLEQIRSQQKKVYYESKYSVTSNLKEEIRTIASNPHYVQR